MVQHLWIVDMGEGRVTSFYHNIQQWMVPNERYLFYIYPYWLQMQFILIGDNTQDELISQFGFGAISSRSIGKWLTVIIWQKKEIENSVCECVCLRKTSAGSFHEYSISILIIIIVIVILILQNIHKRVYVT